MKNLFKYIGLVSLLLFSFYYTEKMSSAVINKSSLVKEINKVSDEYNIISVSAIIDNDYIIPGLNGYAVNVLKSYNNMRYLDSFNSYYLEYDKVLPDVSLENNKDKIIKYGNNRKNGIAIILKNNIDVLNYIKENNLKINRLIDKNTFSKTELYEQINNDNTEYDKVEKMLNNANINHDLCYINKNIIDICREHKKYLIEESLVLNSYNLANIKEKIKSGYIIYVNDNVSVSDFKLLIKQIYYQNLKLLYLSELISEDR